MYSPDGCGATEREQQGKKRTYDGHGAGLLLVPGLELLEQQPHEEEDDGRGQPRRQQLAQELALPCAQRHIGEREREKERRREGDGRRAAVLADCRRTDCGRGRRGAICVEGRGWERERRAGAGGEEKAE